MANRIIILLVCLFSVSCTQKSNFVAQIDGWNNDTIFVIYHAWSGSKEILDTLVAKDGRIEYNNPVADTTEALFISQRSMAPRANAAKALPMMAQAIMTVMTPASKESVTGKLSGNTLTYSSKGSKFYSDKSRIRTECLPYTATLDSLYLIMESGGPNDQMEATYNQIRSQRKEVAKIELEYIKANLGTDLAASFLLSQPRDVVVEFIEKLTPEARNGLYEGRITQRLTEIEAYNKTEEAKLKIVVGAEAPNFTLPALNGGQKSLSDFKGKWVVLDFWGSWCGWCIKGFPQLQEAYAKYNGKVEVIGIDCGDSDEDWRKAVAEHKLDWVQLKNNEKEVDKNTAVMYAVQGYPTKLIISPDQKIANITVGEDPNFYVELNKLIKTK